MGCGGIDERRHGAEDDRGGAATTGGSGVRGGGDCRGGVRGLLPAGQWIGVVEVRKKSFYITIYLCTENNDFFKLWNIS